jgi:tetratricopeptide (TPR) repeat protein
VKSVAREARIKVRRRLGVGLRITAAGIAALALSGCNDAPRATPGPVATVAEPRPRTKGRTSPRPPDAPSVSARASTARPPLPESFEGLREEALALAAALRGRRADAPEPIDLEAAMHDRFGNLAAATSLWEAWLDGHPDSAEAHFRLGKYARERGEETLAVEHLEQAFAARPDLPGAQVLLGESLTNLGRAGEAVEVLAREFPATARNPNRLTLLGHARLQGGDPAGAKGDFERALAIDPASSHALYGLSTACSRLGETEAAARHQAEFANRKAQSLARDRANAKARLDDMPALLQAMAGWYTSAGRIDAAWGDAAAAERDWLRALDFAPAQAAALGGLVDLYRRQGREEEAQTLVERSAAARSAPQRRP